MAVINASLNELAKSGNSQAQYTYGKELLSTLRNNELSDRKALKEFLKFTNEYLSSAAKKGVHSAYFYLGMMYMEGLHVQKD